MLPKISINPPNGNPSTERPSISSYDAFQEHSLDYAIQLRRMVEDEHEEFMAAGSEHAIAAKAS
jgi:hypothetical protein